MATTNSSPTKTKLPDGPKFTLIDNIQATLDLFGLLDKRYQEYGSIFYVAQSSLFPPTVVLSDPQAIEKVFTADPKFFELKNPADAPISPLVGENSLILLDGTEHRRQRKLLMPTFHGGRMKSYGQTMVDATKEVIGQWQVGQTICIRDYTQEISLRIIMQTIFGLKSGQKYDRLRNILLDWLEILNSPLKSCLLFLPILQKDLGALSPWGKFIKQRQIIHEILDQEINNRRNNQDLLGSDILSLMLSIRDEDGQPMGDVEIRDELMTMLFAGHETTANTLAWSFYWLHYLPQTGQKCQAELDSLDGNADLMTIAKLSYLNAVVSETLRLNPVLAFVSRTLKYPFELSGYTFEAGVSLSPCIYLTHQREDIYPQPKKFKPERFLEQQFSPYEYFPFGGGNRRCLGEAFSLYEMKLVLATILSQVELELLDKKPLKALRRGITFTPDGGVKMRVRTIKNV
ncbi:MAG: cytochrome P450 [Cyanobacteria bacterium P01_G01_bin.39]